MVQRPELRGSGWLITGTTGVYACFSLLRHVRVRGRLQREPVRYGCKFVSSADAVAAAARVEDSSYGRKKRRTAREKDHVYVFCGDACIDQRLIDALLNCFEFINNPAFELRSRYRCVDAHVSIHEVKFTQIRARQGAFELLDGAVEMIAEV